MGLTLSMTASLMPLILMGAIAESPNTTATDDSIAKPNNEPVISVQSAPEAVAEPEEVSAAVSEAEPKRIAEAGAAAKEAAAQGDGSSRKATRRVV